MSIQRRTAGIFSYTDGNLKRPEQCSFMYNVIYDLIQIFFFFSISAKEKYFSVVKILFIFMLVCFKAIFLLFFGKYIKTHSFKLKKAI